MSLSKEEAEKRSKKAEKTKKMKAKAIAGIATELIKKDRLLAACKAELKAIKKLIDSDWRPSSK